MKKITKILLVCVACYVFYVWYTKRQNQQAQQVADAEKKQKEQQEQILKDSQMKSSIQQIVIAASHNIRTSTKADIGIWNQVIDIPKEYWDYFLECWINMDGRSLWTAITANCNDLDFTKKGSNLFGTKSAWKQRNAIWRELQNRKKNW